MRFSKKKQSTILWVEAFGFSIIILLSWFTEIVHIPHLVFGQDFVPNWQRAVLRTAIILLVWAWVHAATARLLKRLHHLEQFLQVCAWCRKVCHEEQWLTMEKYFDSKFSTPTSHGMCPDCAKRLESEEHTHHTTSTGHFGNASRKA
ncbi:MAG TPA: hypothetical protein VGO57_00075 [Verrucomicrobiae bacterium]|jgi:hypothetical protein